jgi:excisionase family DNA binding protein
MRFNTIEELAEHFSVSVSTIRNWVKANHIPKSAYVKIGSTYRFSVEKVEQSLLEAGTEDHKNAAVEGQAKDIEGIASDDGLSDVFDEHYTTDDI